MNQGMRIFLPQAVEIGFAGLGNGVVGTLRAATEAVENDEENRQGFHEKI
jgi:hypothetical protein